MCPKPLGKVIFSCCCHKFVLWPARKVWIQTFLDPNKFCVFVLFIGYASSVLKPLKLSTGQVLLLLPVSQPWSALKLKPTNFPTITSPGCLFVQLGPIALTFGILPDYVNCSWFQHVWHVLLGMLANWCNKFTIIRYEPAAPEYNSG